jgi:tetratricopeptide (TPR) repeat protein
MAIESYSLALGVEPENGRALRGRADSYRHLAKWPEAKADLDALEKFSPKLVGDLRDEVEREYAEQEAASKKIQALRRGNEARKELDASRPPEEARKMKDLRGENASSPEAKEAFDLGNKHLQGGAFDLAAECYGRAIRLGYGRPSRCQNGAGLALSMMGQDDMALESFSAAIKLDPSDPRVYHNRAAVYKRLNKFREAALDAAAAYDTASLWNVRLPPIVQLRCGDVPFGGIKEYQLHLDESVRGAVAELRGVPEVWALTGGHAAQNGGRVGEGGRLCDAYLAHCE